MNPATWTQTEWIFVLIAGAVVIALLYHNRDKVKNLLGGGGKGSGDVKPRRK